MIKKKTTTVICERVSSSVVLQKNIMSISMEERFFNTIRSKIMRDIEKFLDEREEKPNVYNTVYIELNTDDSGEFFINPETGQYDFTVTAHIKRLGRFTGECSGSEWLLDELEDQR